jgi:hypothetical protein
LQADWEIEIGGDAPVIDASWPGFMDLRNRPGRAAALPEVRLLPQLAPALVHLNTPHSPFFTAKCDVWPLDQIDPLEFEASSESSSFALACYIDMVPRDPELWPRHEQAIAWCEGLCARLHVATLPNCRADLILRRAIVAPDRHTYGLTAYLSACGARAEAAHTQLAAALAAFVDAVASADPPTEGDSKLQ